MLRAAEAQASEGPDSTFGILWTCGLVLVLIGAIWVSKTAFLSLRCCLRRLHGVASGPQDQSGPYEDDEGLQSTSLRVKRARTKGGGRQSSEEELGIMKEEETEGEEPMKSTRFSKMGTRRGELPDDEQFEDQELTSSRRSSLPKTLRRRSGSTSGATSSRMSGRSTGEAECDAARAASEAAESAQKAAEAANHAAECAEVATEMLQRAMAKPKAQPIQRISSGSENPWNGFQHLHAKRGWSQEKMRAEYYKMKSQGNVP